jgi:ferredoxin-fold anticodon binding domain-containing protein
MSSIATQKQNNKYDITIFQEAKYLDQENNVSLNIKMKDIYSDTVIIGTCENGNFTADIEGKSATCDQELASIIQEVSYETFQDTIIYLQNISSENIIDVYEYEEDKIDEEVLNFTMQYKSFNFQLTEIEFEDSQKKCTSSLSPISTTDTPMDSYSYFGKLSHTNNQAMTYNYKPLYLFKFYPEEEKNSQYLIICDKITN